MAAQGVVWAAGRVGVLAVELEAVVRDGNGNERIHSYGVLFHEMTMHANQAACNENLTSLTRTSHEMAVLSTAVE